MCNFGGINQIAMKRTLLYIIAMTLLAAAGCSRISRNPDLLRADALTATDPRAALRLLDSLPSAGPSETDRHFRDLLSVKAADKAYIAHTSDSLILDAAAWFKGTDLHPEALYYAGRVYSDLGDYPTALRYFQNALDSLPEDNDILRGNVAGQTARLMSNLRMYSKALPFAETALKSSLNSGDTVCSIYDRILIGNIMVCKDDLDVAEKYYTDALNLARRISPKDTVEALSELGTLQYERRHYQQSYEILSQLHDKADKNEVNYILGYLANSCLKIQRPESAAQYAREMLRTGSANNLRTAYFVLIQPEIRPFLDSDSIDYYFDKYLEVTERHYNAHEQQAAIIQASMYDYSIHERARQQAESENDTLIIILIGAVAVIMATLCVILFLRYRYQKSKNELFDVNYRLNVLNKAFEIKSSNTSPSDESSHSDVDDDREAIAYRTELNEYIESLDKLSEKRYAVPECILNSQTYVHLKNAISQNRAISDNDPIWDELLELICRVSPDFDKKIRILSEGRITTEEFHTILLIKAGIKPAEQSKVFGREACTITFRRRTIGEKIINGKLSPALVDRLIQNL